MSGDSDTKAVSARPLLIAYAVLMLVIAWPYFTGQVYTGFDLNEQFIP